LREIETVKQHQKQDPNKARRAFIGGALTAGAGAAIAAVVPGAAVSAEIDPADAKPENKGYQLTEHVLDYYRSAAE
jgi:hypothetical protein